MTKLLAEASVDDQFNVQLGKIQQAIIKLENLIPNFDGVKPVQSQKTALQDAISDLKLIEAKLFSL